MNLHMGLVWSKEQKQMEKNYLSKVMKVLKE